MSDLVNIKIPTIQNSNTRVYSTILNNNDFYSAEISPFQKSNNYENAKLNNQFYMNNNLNKYKPRTSLLSNQSQNNQNRELLKKTANNNIIGISDFQPSGVTSETDSILPNFNRYSNDDDFRRLGSDNINSRVILNNTSQKTKFVPLSNTLDLYVDNLTSNEKKINNNKNTTNNYKYINNYNALGKKSLENGNKVNNNLKRYTLNTESLHLKSDSFLNPNQKINRRNNNYNKMLTLRRKMDSVVNKNENITYNGYNNDFLMNNFYQNFSTENKKFTEKNSKNKNDHSADNFISKINYGSNLKYNTIKRNNALKVQKNNFNKNFYSAQKIKDKILDKEIDDIVDNIQFPLFTNDNEVDKKSDSELSVIADDIVAAFQTENNLSSTDTKDIQENFQPTFNNENDLINSNNTDLYNNKENNKNIVINSYINNRKNQIMDNKVIYGSREKPTIVNNFFISQPNTQKNMSIPDNSKNINYSLFVLDNVNNNIINNNNITNNTDGLVEMKSKTYQSPFLFKKIQNQNRKYKSKNKRTDLDYGLSDNETITNKLKLLTDDDFEELLTNDKDSKEQNDIDYFITKKIRNFRNTGPKTPNFEGRSYEDKIKNKDQFLNQNNNKMDLINKRPSKKNNINEITNLKEILSSKKNRSSMTSGIDTNKPGAFNNYYNTKNNMGFNFNKNQKDRKRHICINLNKNIIIAFDKNDLITKSEITSNGKLLPKVFKDMNTYQYELKIAQPQPILKPYNKEDIGIDNTYILVENLPERQILPELYDDFEDDDIKSLEKSLEKSVDKIFDNNFK